MPPSSPVPLRLAGRYELLRTQATDANTASLLAWDTRLKAWRSIRVARPGDEAASRRMLAVAQWAAKLEHPALERVIDVGTDGTVVYVVRDRLVGSVSDHLRRRGAVAPEWALQAVVRCAEGLTWAHARGIVHGQPRPDVVQFSEDGSAVLTSFGQRAVLRDTPETRAGADWAHLAPELRQAWQPDAATDVYALGALLYMMVAGKPSADLFYAEAYEGLLSAIPRSLRPLLHRACAFAPTERYDSTALHEALRKAQGEFPRVQGSAPWLESTQDFPDRNQYDGMDAILREIAPHLETPQPEAVFGAVEAPPTDPVSDPVSGSSAGSDPVTVGSAPVRSPIRSGSFGSAPPPLTDLGEETVPPGTSTPPPSEEPPSAPTPSSGRSWAPTPPSAPRRPAPTPPPRPVVPAAPVPTPPPSGTPPSTPRYLAPPPSAPREAASPSRDVPVGEVVGLGAPPSEFPSGGESFAGVGYATDDTFAPRPSKAPETIRTDQTRAEPSGATRAEVLRVVLGASIVGLFLASIGASGFWYWSTAPDRADRALVQALEAETTTVARILNEEPDLQDLWRSFTEAPANERATLAANLIERLEARIDAAPFEYEVEQAVRRLGKERERWRSSQR